MGNSDEDEGTGLLATSSVVNGATTVLCFKDHTCAPQFQVEDADYKDDTVSEIKQNFKDLSVEINGILKKEYARGDRQRLGRKKNVFYPLVLVLNLVMIAVGIFLIIGFTNKWDRYSHYYDYMLLYLSYGLCTLFGLIVVIVCCFFCCMGGTGYDEEKRFNQEAKHAVDNWNLTHQDGVRAEFKEEHEKRRAGRKGTTTIRACINLWKADLESQPLV